MMQKLLGHNNIKTTLHYLHVTNKDLLSIISPLGDLKLKPRVAEMRGSIFLRCPCSNTRKNTASVPGNP